MRHAAAVLGTCAALVCSPAQAATARDILVGAAFGARDKASALVSIGQVIASADGALKHDPGDYDARLQRALAISYRGKLNRSRADVVTARREIEAVVAADPRNAEAQLALSAWHFAAIIELGPMLARTVLGARTATGTQALARAMALGANHASIPALASMQRIQLDPSDIAGARRLAEKAMGAGADTAFDRVMQRNAGILLVSLRKGDGRVAAAMAKLLMPFGRVN